MAVAQEVERVVHLPEGQRFNPSSSSRLHAEVSLGKILNPKLLPMAVCECVFVCLADEQVGTSYESCCHKCVNVCFKEPGRIVRGRSRSQEEVKAGGVVETERLQKEIVVND